MIKNYLKSILVFFCLSIVLIPIHGQVKQSHSIVIGSLQLKDEFNLGMVFNGAQLEYRYSLKWEINDHEILYQPKVGAGLAYNREMTGGQIHIAPINVTWTMPFYVKNGHTIRGGANFVTDYNYHFYELNDSPLFWTAEIGFSPVMQYGYQWDNKRVTVNLQNSLFGFTSHRQGYDPYLWIMDWKDFVVEPNKNFKFGSINNYNHTNISLEFVPNISKIHSFAYEFDYLGLFWGNQFHRINHNLFWRMSL